MAEIRTRKIERLPADVVGRIAAGEMIVRPSAAIKELLENALDAQAGRISVVVSEALDRRFQVIDDGVGIPREELRLALERYATNKITCEEDLLRVETLGFRGEALAAIAEISRLTITSRTAESEHAWTIHAEPGAIGEPEAAARALGTTVAVEDLFFNTPVRKRFLKKGPAEMRLARAIITAQALAVPGVGWSLELDGKRLLDMAPAPDLRSRLIQVHGKRIADGLLAVDWRDDGLALHGFLGVPELARAGRLHQTLFVNGRCVSSPWLGQAIRQGYGDLIPSHQQPWAVLFVTVAPDRVDVNLHPTKREVRFLEERLVFGCIQRAVRQAVAQLLPRFFLGASGSQRGSDAAGSPAGTGIRAGGGPRPSGAASFDGLEAAGQLYGGGSQGAGLSSDSAGSEGGLGQGAGGDEEAGVQAVIAGTEARPLGGEGSDSLVSLWQLHSCYVLAQTRKGLLIIDQHAAHERILYERILARMTSEATGAQQLLFPVVQELTEEEADLFQELKGNLARMGFDLEEVGERSVLVRGVPPIWRARSEAGLLRDLLDEAACLGIREGETLEGLARAFACRAAIKAGAPLSVEEMNRLVDELFATEMPHGDPHGRPTFVFISLHELNRRFGRSAPE
jgi:DNA mismatch repair protein MutL